METPHSKQALQTAITQERARFQAALARVDPAHLSQAGVEGDWRVQDVLAHITAWEQMMLGWLHTLTAGGVPDRQSPGQPWPEVDRINADIFARNQGKPLAEIVAAFRASFAAVQAAVAQAAEELLLQPDFSPWNNGVPFAYLAAANTCWHYAEHVQAMEDWADLHPAKQDGN